MMAVHFIIFLLVAAGSAAPNDELAISLFNVGYGDAILLTQGEAAALIDTGYPEEEASLFAALERHRIDRLDLLILTHPHPDHIGNAAAAVRRLQPQMIADNGEIVPLPAGRLTAELIDDYLLTVRGSRNYRVLRRGMSFNLGTASLRVLWPTATRLSKDWNTNSAVILLTFGRFRALLEGDGNETTEIALIEMGEPLAADLLKVGHHGAADAATARFIQAVNPRWAAISVGENPWGIPSGETLRRLNDAGSRIFSTSRDGEITFRIFSDGQVWVYTDRFTPLIFLNAPPSK